MKKLLGLFLCLLMMLCACTTEGKVPLSEAEPQETVEKYSETVILYGDRSFGVQGGEEDMLTTYTVTMEEPLSAMKLADALSQWSGLDFEIQPTEVLEDSIAIDWEETATLFSAEMPQNINEGLHIDSREELCWFMLDSLALTLQENLNVKDVYYTMGGGEPLLIEETDIHIPQLEAYPGSSRLAEDRNRALARFSQGNWYLNGSLNGEHIERMDDGYVWYDAEGKILSRGSIVYQGKTDSDWKLALVEDGASNVLHELEFISGTEFIMDGRQYVKKEGEPVSVFAETAGYWRYEDKSGTASIQMNGNGTYICYDEAGDYVAAGELERYNAWTYQMLRNGEYVGSFEMISDRKLSMDGEEFVRYAEPAEDKLTGALRREIIRQHESTFLTGIMEAAGWHIVDQFEQEGLLWVYAHSMFAEYDYKYGDFTMVREVEEPALFRFHEMNGEYELWDYFPLNGSLSAEETAPYFAALDDRGKNMTVAEGVKEAMEAMCDMDAQEYLYRDGSDAEIWRKH